MEDHFDPRTEEVSAPLCARIKPELKPGERLLWASRADHPSPTETRRSTASGLTWGLGLGGIAAACLFLLAPLLRGIGEAPTNITIVAGLAAAILCPFVLLGTLVNTLLRRWETRRLAGRMYAVTTLRAIIWDPVPGSSAVTVHTFPGGTIRGEHLRRVQYPDGSGDVIFLGEYLQPAGFVGVADVRRVEDLIRRFLIGPTQTRSSVPANPEP